MKIKTMQRIIVVLILAALLQMSMLSFTYLEENHDGTPYNEAIKPDDGNKDKNVDAILDEMGIETSVDEKALNEKYPGVEIAFSPNGRKLSLQFHNPEANNFRLDIFDIEGFIVASYINIYGEVVYVESGILKSGEYTYKLEGQGNTYCGKIAML